MYVKSWCLCHAQGTEKYNVEKAFICAAGGFRYACVCIWQGLFVLLWFVFWNRLFQAMQNVRARMNPSVFELMYSSSSSRLTCTLTATFSSRAAPIKMCKAPSVCVLLPHIKFTTPTFLSACASPAQRTNFGAQTDRCWRGEWNEKVLYTVNSRVSNRSLIFSVKRDSFVHVARAACSTTTAEGWYGRGPKHIARTFGRYVFVCPKLEGYTCAPSTTRISYHSPV